MKKLSWREWLLLPVGIVTVALFLMAVRYIEWCFPVLRGKK